MDVHRYVVIYERTATGYSAFVPDVRGCIAAGDTLEESAHLMREALMLHLESMEQDGLPVPVPVSAR